MGSGKSLVCSIFKSLDIPVFDADQQTKLLYTESDIRLKIQKQFGKSVYQGDDEDPEGDGAPEKDRPFFLSAHIAKG